VMACFCGIDSSLFAFCQAGAAAAAAAEALQRRMQRQKAAGLVPEGLDSIDGKLDLDPEDEVNGRRSM